MGYGTRRAWNGTIKTYWPDDDDNTMHLDMDSWQYNMQEILDKIKEKWGTGISLDNIQIGAEHIHTDCLGYDLYDPSDYTYFLVLTKVK